MKTKKILTFLISLGVVGLLLVGCNKDDEELKGIDKESKQSEVIKEGKIVPSVEIAYSDSGQIIFKYTVENKTKSDQNIIFNSAEKIKYSVKDESGKEVFNSNIISYAQVVEEVFLKKNSKETFDIEVANLPIGIYSFYIQFNGKIDGYKIDDLAISHIKANGNEEYNLNEDNLNEDKKDEAENKPVENKPVENNNSSIKEKEDNVDIDKIKVTGTLVGWADGHTVEVIVEGEHIAYQIFGEAASKLANFEDGDEVSMFYTDDGLTRLIVDVE